jgi:DNA-binding CsgD family transcriptional regulator
MDVAMDGGIVLPRDLTFRALARERASTVTTRGAHPLSILTERELQILGWLAEGHSNRQIAERLVISEHTVRAHLRNLMRKLGVNNRAQAAAVAATYLTTEAEPTAGKGGR